MHQRKMASAIIVERKAILFVNAGLLKGNLRKMQTMVEENLVAMVTEIYMATKVLGW